MVKSPAKEKKLSAKYNDKKLLKRGNMYKYNGKGYKWNVITATKEQAISRRTYKTKEIIEAITYFMVLQYVQLVQICLNLNHHKLHRAPIH